MKIIAIGGGAASFFFAAEVSSRLPQAEVTILEQGKNVLGKVLVSGGGRCNVTHYCLDPKELVQNYPRGSREMLGPFYHFGPQQTIDWFEEKGISLKVEEDGRMFPTTDSSETIAQCLIDTCTANQVRINTQSKVTNIKPLENKTGFEVHLLNGTKLHANKLFVAPGSSRQLWQVLEHLGLNIIADVPSLFTFQIKDKSLTALAGISVEHSVVQIENSKIQTVGPLLITHKGLSGPAILKASAWGARELFERAYKFNITIDFLPQLSHKEIQNSRHSFGPKKVGNHQVWNLAKRLHIYLIHKAGLKPEIRYGDLSKDQMDRLTEVLKKCPFHVVGKNTFKEEFVTAGGVDLNEIDFRNFESKKISGMHLGGEVLNIDAVTGGFNFQAAWTAGYLAALGMSEI